MCQLLSLILPFTFYFSVLFETLWHLLIFVWISLKLLKKKRKRKPNKQNVIKHQKTEWLSNYPMITIDLLGEIFPLTCQRLYDWQNYWLGVWNEEHLSIWSIFLSQLINKDSYLVFRQSSAQNNILGYKIFSVCCPAYGPLSLCQSSYHSLWVGEGDDFKKIKV